MKQKDIALIAFIVGFSAIVSIFISNALISSPKNRQEKVEVVEKIDPVFPTPDSKYFNKNALDPTELIEIDNNSNKTPISGGQ